MRRLLLYYISIGDIEGLISEAVCDVTSDTYRTVRIRTPLAGLMEDNSVDLKFHNSRYIQNVKVDQDGVRIEQFLLTSGRRFCDSKKMRKEFLGFLKDVENHAAELDGGLKKSLLTNYK